MKKVLILGVAAVQMDAIIELKKMGIKTYAIAQANDGPASKVVDYFEKINFVNKNKVIEFIKKHKIDCIYTVGSDIAVPISAEISEELDLPYFVPKETAVICNNKNYMREYFGSDFEGNVKYQILKDFNTELEIDYPFIMKPSDSQGQRGVRLIKNSTDFMESFEMCKKYSRAGLVLIEDYIEGPEISVNAYVVDGKAVFMVHSDREVWTQYSGGLIHKHIVPSQNITNSEAEVNLESLINRTVDKLEIENGPLYFQIKFCGNKPYIIEVTPRLDGCHMWRVLNYYTNVNLIKLTFEKLLFGSSKELANYNVSGNQYTLEFICELPNKYVDYSKFNIPPTNLCMFKYYKDKDIVRPINNQYEKVGYFITKNGGKVL
ncbi:ATP-grasp domain-containing protein [Thalassobacillus pellis]|uniref:ATP-grasp domain-containing protein n=1 Tax=Thalassobacillus pellis TaxID=748008 RepID=UPI001EF800F7|nr:ATP-grasp domain-containing protein [Thalassobacillus pellis]MBM7551666.1 biotin carboxylase [Thalassobacillus pellis]